MKSQEVDRKRRAGLFLQTREKFLGPEELSESVASSTFDGTSDPMRYIASVVANAVEFGDLHEKILEIEWDLKNYVLAEMSAGQLLDDMLTVTGTTDCAWAATCKEYRADVAKYTINSF